ncbi:MAG: NADP-dependent malic enzyme [Chloroflexi bacterium]|nr:NADP-dependent malic enzyme [Chloroflexota bacterium]
MRKITRKDALDYHKLDGKPGKLAIVPTKPLGTQRDLSLAYSPGVAVPVLEIEKDPHLAYEYTAKGNLVAVISNGTAILGLGNRGGLASKPVMEGKAVLFKTFADIDVFDIELDVEDPDELIRVVAAIAPTFGGINLEDIKAPECFYIEEKLKAMLPIPVFHDDQHGTAIISGAGLINGLEIVGKKIEDIKMVISGAGASAVASAKHAIALGVRRENICMTDSRGVIYKGRTERMNEYKEYFAIETDARTLADAVRGADVFYGLSIANVLTPEMVKSMADRPLIFAMANPDPEIKYDLAKEARPDAIVATGRSDYPNQINNVLGFPFLFRGALDVQASAINYDMKIAASYALANLAKEDVPDSVLRAYGIDSLKFGPEYIIPTPFDPRVLLWVSPAVAKAAMDSGVARQNVDLDAYLDELTLRQGKRQQVRQFIIDKAKAAPPPKRIVFAEGKEVKIIRAASQVAHERIGHPILLGNPAEINATIAELEIDFAPEIIDPNHFPRLDEYAQAYHELRQRKGITLDVAHHALENRSVLGPMMLKMGDAEAFISGLTHEYPDVLRPALEIHHTRPDVHRVAGVTLVIVDKRIYLLADVAVNVEPTAEDLAEIAALTADFARQLEMEPRIAMLSFSNFGSTRHPDSNKVREAVQRIKTRYPDLQVDGEMQADTATSARIMAERFSFSEVKDANILIFPDLDAANSASKLLGTLGKARLIGPVLLGFGAPIHILQPKNDVADIVSTAALAVVDAQNRQQ